MTQPSNHIHTLSATRSHTKGATGTAHLTYFIYEAELLCSFGQQTMSVEAVSGGAGGSKDTAKGKARVRTVAVNNPYYTGFKQKSNEPGGPLPTGPYLIDPPSVHGHMGLCAKLRFPKGATRKGRDGFYIHAQVRLGSDGCIVVIGPKHFHEVMDKLKASGGGVLHVLESIEPVRFA